MDAIEKVSETAKHDAGNTSEVAVEITKEIELEKGRVWRRGLASTYPGKKKAAGPVLRTTVKPVKRFRPDPIVADRSNPSPSRKKRIRVAGAGTTSAGKSSEDPYLQGDDANEAESSSVTSNVPGKTNDGIRPDDEKSHEKEKKSTPNKQAPNPAAPPTKKKRQWEQWSVVDKDYFFEAVALYGKDFEAITSAIAQKQRKKGGEDCVARTKDQVRHLYYRTWGMISKLIDTDAYPININKAFQELYAVINYGEIRKKLGGSLKKKGIEKLNELIREGTTSTRVKGKNFRIKTPSCKALKKMNPEYQGKEGIVDLPLVSDTRKMKIPLHVTLELFPLSMAAWNQVHSIAHNPRLRIKLSVECQLSAVFTYLEKKWKPLSSRLFQIAGQCQSTKSAAPNHKLVKQKHPSIWDRVLCIQTPPDASVNTRIMVFQVSNNKTHCVVSYALRKCSMNQEKLPEDNIANETRPPDAAAKEQESEMVVESVPEDTTSGAVSESEVIESCPSSEEDYDCDSTNEDALKDNGISQTVPRDNQNKNSTLKTSFCSKEKVTGTAENVKSSVLLPLVDTAAMVTKPVSVDADCPVDNATKVAGTEETHVAAMEVENLAVTGDKIRHESVEESMNDSCSVGMVSNQSSTVSQQQNGTSVPTDDKPAQVNGDCNSSHTDSSNDHCDVGDATDSVGFVPKDRVNLQADNNKSHTACDVNDVPKEEEPGISPGKIQKKEKPKKLVLSNKLFRKADTKKHKKSVRKNFTKTVQRWTGKDCRKTTVAEIYMILGKPAVFRLCYDWIQTSTGDGDARSEPGSLNAKSEVQNAACTEKVSLSTGLLALIQAAKLTRLTEGSTKPSNQAKTATSKSSSAHKTKVKHVATQCDIKKAEDKHSGSTFSSANNPHGRGISKVMPVETVLVNTLPAGTGFAIPAVPSRRLRTNAASPAEPLTATMVSAEMIDLLLRRERLRNTRQIRKPMLVERGAKSLRSMKTFSIVTQGPNKVGFLPSRPIVARPAATTTSSSVASGDTAGTSETMPSQTPASDGSSVTMPSQTPACDMAANSSSGSSSLNIEKLLELDASEAGNTNITMTSSDSGNLLALAAKEAGVAPPTPRKVESEEKVMEIAETEKVDAHAGPCTTNEYTGDVPMSVVENSDLLTEAFGKQPDSSTSTAATQLTMAVSSEPLTQFSSSPPRVLAAPGFCTSEASSIEPLLELSWSGHEIPPSAFSAGDSLLDKLVGSDDAVLSSFGVNSTPDDKRDGSLANPRLMSPSLKGITDENSNDSTSSKSVPGFDLHIATEKSSELAVHPWTINTGSRDGVGLCGLLNTPQKVLQSDTEDSMDDFLAKRMPKRSSNTDSERFDVAFPIQGETKRATSSDSMKRRHVSQDQNSSSNFLAETEVDLQLQCMMNENSVDYISKFQDLVRQTADDDELPPVISSDENARDGHQTILSDTLVCLESPNKDKKDDG